MKVAFDLSATHNGHQFRGIGFYAQNLFSNLTKLAEKDKKFTLVKYEKNIQADLYHFPAFNPFFFSFPLNLVKKSIITIHDLIPIEYTQHYPAGIKGNLRWQIQKFILQKAKHIITDSQASKKAIINILPIDAQKISVVYLGASQKFKKIIDKKKLIQIQGKYNLPDKFLVYIGDLNWNKNIVRLTKICLAQKWPLIVVGKQAINREIDHSHPWNQELVKFQSLAQENTNIIKTLGFVSDEDLVNILNMATALIQPSIAEGFGLPILEAMQSGCPVVCSNTSSLPEIGGQAVAYFNPLDRQDMEKAIKKSLGK